MVPGTRVFSSLSDSSLEDVLQENPVTSFLLYLTGTSLE
jgi:hypothetical protein